MRTTPIKMESSLIIVISVFLGALYKVGLNK